ncbi:Alpha/Beta hydrolase protein [Paraphoma chrysanthemicola]|nr:Alpha/Beta hydrolase protein [Paraphoma chrysanthemicola]
MALSFITSKLSPLPRIFSPLTSALFSSLPFWQRWRVLFLQPINIIAALLTAPAWLFTNRYKVIYVPTKTGNRRCLVFMPPRTSPGSPHDHLKARDNGSDGLRPLHIDIHGGAWIGGFPEHNARFCAHLSDETGAVVVSISYRIAPRHIYPAAHDDVDDVVTWLVSHARDFGADGKFLTIGGGSVGAGLGLSACRHLLQAAHLNSGGGELDERPRDGDGGGVKPLAWIGICPALDFRVAPKDKPKPASMQGADPLAFLLPLFDVYAGTERGKHLEDERLHPILLDEKVVPGNVLIVAAGIDPLLAEGKEFAERLGRERNGSGVEIMVVDNGFHGFVELPSFVLEQERLQVFAKAVALLRKKAKFIDERLYSLVGEVAFWMDTITVNQKDQAEVISTVQAIPTSFQDAKKTIAVREGDGLYNCCVDAVRGWTDFAELKSRMMPHVVGSHDEDIYTESYVDRLWTLQECLLSHTIEFTLATEGAPMKKPQIDWAISRSDDFLVRLKEIEVQLKDIPIEDDLFFERASIVAHP